MKDLTITPMYLMKPKGQVGKNANALQTQWYQVTQSIQECPMSIVQWVMISEM